MVRLAVIIMLGLHCSMGLLRWSETDMLANKVEKIDPSEEAQRADLENDEGEKAVHVEEKVQGMNFSDVVALDKEDGARPRPRPRRWLHRASTTEKPKRRWAHHPRPHRKTNQTMSQAEMDAMASKAISDRIDADNAARVDKFRTEAAEKVAAQEAAEAETKKAKASAAEFASRRRRRSRRRTARDYHMDGRELEEVYDDRWEASIGHKKPKKWGAEDGDSRVENHEIDCDEHNGDLCKWPFKCAGTSMVYRPAQSFPNYHMWCGYPAYAYAGLMCYQKRYVEYGDAMLKAAITRGLGVMGVEAQFCFAYGHCDDDEFEESSATSTQAIRVCNREFGESWWPKDDEAPGAPIYNRVEGGLNATTGGSTAADSGFTRRRRAKRPRWSTTVLFSPSYSTWRLRERAKKSCAMGNYHCDAMMCKNHYCKQQYYRNKFNSMRPAAGVKKHGQNYPIGWSDQKARGYDVWIKGRPGSYDGR